MYKVLNFKTYSQNDILFTDLQSVEILNFWNKKKK